MDFNIMGQNNTSIIDENDIYKFVAINKIKWFWILDDDETDELIFQINIACLDRFIMFFYSYIIKKTCDCIILDGNLIRFSMNKVFNFYDINIHTLFPKS